MKNNFHKVSSKIKNFKSQRCAFIICLTLFILMFPKYNNYPSFFGIEIFTLFLQIILPFLVIMIIFREKLTDYGLSLGNKREGITLSLIFLLAYIPFFLILLNSGNFFNYYIPTLIQISSLKSLVILEAKNFIEVLKCEFIFRGFLLFGLKKEFGDNNSILVQTIPYSLVHIGNPELECYGSILVGLSLGYLALRTRSIWYGFMLHWLISGVFSLVFLYKINKIF